MFCCGAEIVPKRSQCEQKPYPLCNLQRSLLIWKDNLPKRGSVVISAPIKVFGLDSDRLKNLSDTERSTFNSGAEQYCSGAETASKAAVLLWTEALSGTLSETLRFTIRYSVNIFLEFFKRGNKMKMSQQAGSNPGPQDHKSDALTTRLPTGDAKPMENLCYLCTQLINVYCS